MNYTQQQIQEWKTRAKKLDDLGDSIASFYGDEEAGFEEAEFDEDGPSLVDIGEIAAMAYGFL